MRLEQAAVLVGLMRASWPNFARDEVADALWLEDLAGCAAEPAERTFRWFRDHLRFAPTWAEFRERYEYEVGTVARRREMEAAERAARRALPPGPQPDPFVVYAEQVRRLAAIRAARRDREAVAACRDATRTGRFTHTTQEDE